MSDRPIQFVVIEEVLNNLMKDEKIRSHRTALVEYVTELLKPRVGKHLAEVGITPSLEKEFLKGNTQPVHQILQENSSQLGISQNKMRKMKQMEKTDLSCAWDYLQKIMLEEEKRCFRKEAGIVSKVWQQFINHTVIPGEVTLEKLRIALDMTPEQLLEFERRVVRYVFQVDQALRDIVHELRKGTGMGVTEFLNYAFIGKDAWEVFYPVKGEPNKVKKTSQDTLLKLVIGFNLDENNAWAFMDTAKSTFAVRRDLVVLACIRCAYTNPIQVQEILEFFAEDGYGERYYKNLYR